MARIKFDIKYRPQIESGEYKVETRIGQTVRIVCWDKKDAQGYANKPIVALIFWMDNTGESVLNYTKEGKIIIQGQESDYDLFLITPDEIFTEFEKAVKDLYTGYLSNLDDNPEFVKEKAAKLMELARKELQPEIDSSVEYEVKRRYMLEYEKGKEDALKDLPKWKKITRPALDVPYVEYDPSSGAHTLFDEKYAIALKDLRELPKEE